MRKTGLKRFVPIIARDPAKKNAGNREISTAFLGKLPVGNSPYSNIKAAETPAVGKIAGKNQEQPEISQKSNRPASPHENVQQSGAVVYVPLRGVTADCLSSSCARSERLFLRPLAGCNGKNEQKQAAANRQKGTFSTSLRSL